MKLMMTRKIKLSLVLCAALGLLSVGAAAPTTNAQDQQLARSVDAEQIGGVSNVKTDDLAKRDASVAQYVSDGRITPATTKDGSGRIDLKLTKPLLSYVSGVVYEQVPSRGFENVAMKMDIIRPQVKPGEKTVYPAVIFVTGGGFINANKDSYLQRRVQLAEAGYVVGSIEYRVAPTAVMPQPLEDVKGAVRFYYLENPQTSKYWEYF